MHLVLRSSKAVGPWSFRKKAKQIDSLINRFGKKYGVKFHNKANVGNHIHLHIQLSSRHTYRPFIRGLTASIAMLVTGASRWNPLGIKFWDRRPFTRVVVGWSAFKKLRRYIEINQLEGHGWKRENADMFLAEYYSTA